MRTHKTRVNIWQQQKKKYVGKPYDLKPNKNVVSFVDYLLSKVHTTRVFQYHNADCMYVCVRAQVIVCLDVFRFKSHCDKNLG